MAGVHLNAAGRSQAALLARGLGAAPISAIYSSPLERARQTAEPVATLLGLPIITRENFLEIDFAQWTDRPFADIDRDPAFQRFNALRSCAPVPGGESMLQAQSRMVLGLETLRAEHPDQTVAVFSHGDLVKAAVAHYAGIALDLFQRLEIGLASTSVVELGERSIRIVAVNAPAGAPLPD